MTIGSFDCNAYRVIIDNHILPFVYNIHGETDQFILQEDNFGSQRALTIATYSVNEKVIHIVWPAQRPDLNPIENVWGFMKNCSRKFSVHPRNPMHLNKILSDMSNSLPDSYSTNLIASMAQRIEIVSKSRGGSTKS